MYLRRPQIKRVKYALFRHDWPRQRLGAQCNIDLAAFLNSAPRRRAFCRSAFDRPPLSGIVGAVSVCALPALAAESDLCRGERCEAGEPASKKGSAARSSRPPGRPAIGGRACRAQAGRPGDELDGIPVRDAADLQLRLGLLRIGEVAEFAVSRDGGFRSSAWVFRSSASRSARNALLVLMCGPSLRF
jgi:hypothetical protein